MKLPIVDTSNFNLFKITPILIITMTSISAECSLIAFSAHRDQYYRLTTHHFNSCKSLPGERYLCPDTQATYSKESNICTCDVDMFNNETQASCDMKNTSFSSVWIELYHKNRWIYGTTSPVKLSCVCGAEIN